MVVKQVFDLPLCFAACMVSTVLILLVLAAVRLTSPGPAMWWLDWVGRNHKISEMLIFRSMRVGSTVAIYLLADATLLLTPNGFFLRNSGLNKLPQVWSILAGDTSFVGSRPTLFNPSRYTQVRNSI